MSPLSWHFFGWSLLWNINNKTNNSIKQEKKKPVQNFQSCQKPCKFNLFSCLPTSWMCRVRCLWCWTSSHELWGSSSDPSLNGQLYYPADVDRILMRLLLTKYSNTVPTIIIVPLTLLPLFLLFLVQRTTSTVRLYTFYFWRLIGKLTVFLQVQELSLSRDGNPLFRYQ